MTSERSIFSILSKFYFDAILIASLRANGNTSSIVGKAIAYATTHACNQIPIEAELELDVNI